MHIIVGFAFFEARKQSVEKTVDEKNSLECRSDKRVAYLFLSASALTWHEKGNNCCKRVKNAENFA